VVSRDKPAQERSSSLMGLEAGYVWDALSTAALRVATPSPKKDGTFDHSANTCEYAWLRWRLRRRPRSRASFTTTPSGSAAPVEQERAEARALKLAQVDHDPPTRPLVAMPGALRSFRGARRSRDSCAWRILSDWLKTTA